jgi:phospholipase/carboxylesterase
MNEKLQILETKDWTIRYKLPAKDGPHPVIWLLHGWTGDEGSMWIFASRLPKHFLLLAPRGLYPAPIGGYSWYTMTSENAWPKVADFLPAIDKLCSLMDKWPETAPPADFSRFRIAGFSQGGALAYSFAMIHPKRVIALAGLASFLPDDAEKYLLESHFDEIRVYISHGSKDHIVPVDRARQATQKFQQAGAQVHYCESDKGHKLSADCFRGMEVFFEQEY